MKIDVPFCDQTAEARSPRIGLFVEHGGLHDDLERALTSAGCRIVAREGEARASTVPSTFDAIVVDADRPRDAAWLGGGDDEPAAIVWLTGSSEQEKALTGAGHVVLAKPFSVAALERALEQALEPAREAPQRLESILRSQESRVVETVARARRLAEQDLAMVIEGELGVGRTALARATHDWSARAGAPLVTLDRLDLGAARADVAVRRIDAAWAEARGGTVVAIEPAEWTPAAQRAFARVLRGDTGARVVTVASESLERAVERGRLTRELADRLDVSRIHLPPLRERPTDHRTLCEAVARRVARRLGVETPAIDDGTIAEWAGEGFPGNLLGVESRLRASMLRQQVEASESGKTLEVRKHEAVADSLDLKALERDTIVRALAHWQGNRTRASESLGISVRTLRNKIREYGLR